MAAAQKKERKYYLLFATIGSLFGLATYVRKECRQLFSALINNHNRHGLEWALGDPVFSSLLILVMDSINTPANDNIMERVYSINNPHFDDLYDNNQSFREFLGFLQDKHLANGGSQLFGVVTPENSPANSP